MYLFRKTMKIKLLFTYLVLWCSVAIQAQNTLNFKNQNLPATELWNFVCEEYALYGTTQLQIAKTSQGGLLKISMPAHDDNAFIMGNLYLDLADGATLICTDKGFRENKDNQMNSFYVFSAAEMNKLQKNNILRVRFQIVSKKKKFGNQNGYFTAVNKKAYFSTYYATDDKTNPTAQAVKALYTTSPTAH